MKDEESSLDLAVDTQTFVAACAEQVRDSAHVSVQENALDDLVPLVAGARPVSWDWFLRNPDGDLAEAAWDFLVTSALNGGYFQECPDGTVRQWEANGSGSAALIDWYRQLREARLVPGADISGRVTALSLLEQRVAGQPHAGERLEILADFAEEGARDAFQAILRATAAAPNRHRFTLADADRVAGLFPRGFGQDPFRKKAILVFLLLAGHIESRGGSVEYDLPVPSDYQIPRILCWKGAISLSPAFEAKLRSGGLIDVRSRACRDLRAAAVVMARELGTRAGVDDRFVDGALFMGFRRHPGFLADAPPPMRCASLWF